MQIFKRNYSANKWPYGEITQDLTSLGFTDLDFNPIIKPKDETDFNFKWGKDRINDFYISMRCSNAIGQNSTIFIPTYSNNTTGPNYMAGSSWNYGDDSTIPSPKIIIIPLKGYGFFFNGVGHWYGRRDWVNYNTIQLNFDFIDSNYVRAVDGFDLICLPTKDKNKFSYIYHKAGTHIAFERYWSSGGGYFSDIKLDLGEKQVYNFLASDGYNNLITDLALSGDYISNPENYIQTNETDCTLMQVYLNNGTPVNGLYCFINKPTQIKNRSIFSIGNRQFICYEMPFVAELPIN